MYLNVWLPPDNRSSATIQNITLTIGSQLAANDNFQARCDLTDMLDVTPRRNPGMEGKLWVSKGQFAAFATTCVPGTAKKM